MEVATRSFPVVAQPSGYARDRRTAAAVVPREYRTERFTLDRDDRQGVHHRREHDQFGGRVIGHAASNGACDRIEYDSKRKGARAGAVGNERPGSVARGYRTQVLADKARRHSA